MVRGWTLVLLLAVATTITWAAADGDVDVDADTDVDFVKTATGDGMAGADLAQVQQAAKRSARQDAEADQMIAMVDKENIADKAKSLESRIKTAESMASQATVAEAKDLEQQHRQSHAKVKKPVSALVASRARLHKASAQVSKLTSQKLSAASSIKATRQQETSLRTEAQKASGDALKLKSKANRLMGMAHALGARYAELQAKSARAQHKAAEHDHLVHTLQRKAAVAKKRKAKLLAKMRAVKKMVAERKHLLRADAKSIEHQRELVDRKKRALQAWKDQLRTARNGVKRASRHVRDVEHEIYHERYGGLGGGLDDEI